MGQTSSRDASTPSERPSGGYWDTHRRASTFLSRPLIRSRTERQYINNLARFQSQPERRPLDTEASIERAISVSQRSRLSRARSSFTNIVPHFLTRTASSPASPQHTVDLSPLPSYHQAALVSNNTSESYLPHLQIPELDLDFGTSLQNLPLPHTPPERERPRSTATIADRISSLRPDIGLRNISASLRRRRSPFPRADDQTAVLSRLLSIAAAATAASLMGNNPRTAVSEMRQSGAVAPGEDGTFDGFLRSLQNGQLATALRQSGADGNTDEDSEDGTTPPLNFFRMFRFGSSSSERRDTSTSSRPPSSGSDESPQADQQPGQATNGTDGRMIPVLIVGIRSMNPENGTGQTIENPFLDALSNFQPPMTPNDGDNATNAVLDEVLRQPRTTNRLGYRRRASMNGFNMFSSGSDSPRRRRSPELTRSRSEAAVASDSPPGPHPPPSTPADPALSAISSGSNTPNGRASAPSNGRFGTSSPRHDNVLPRMARTLLEATAEELPSTSRSPRQSRSSESDYTPRFGSGNPRRNGVVEPDSATAEGSRSWIIYVLGGTYPENHPILTTPSLFTDSPTYEDMLLLSSLLGPAKPPVASAEDVATAPGLFTITEVGDTLAALSASATKESISISPNERCLICLSSYEAGEEARRLVKCGHLYHRECIDEWLTTGRNSCPLCRAQGVDERPKNTTEDAEMPSAPASMT